MASEEQNRRQQELNDFLERELELRAENQAFLGETISKAAQLADQIKYTVGLVKNKVELDNQVLKTSKDNVNVLTRLSASYSDISSLQKDRVKVEKQLVANANIMAARQASLTKELGDQAAIELEKGRAFLQQEKALEAQQQKLEKQIDAAEKLKKEQEARIAAGERLDAADRALLRNAEGAVRMQQTKTAQILAEVDAASKLVDPRSVEVALLEEQNKNLEEAVGYLDEEEEKLKNIVKNQAFWNISLGAAQGFLKKMGLESAVLSFGLEEGAAAAEEMAKKLSNGGEKSLGFLDQLKVLGAGAVGTFKGMAKALKQAFSLAAIGTLFGKMIGGLMKPVTSFVGDLKSKFMAGIDYIKNEFFSLDSYIADAKAGDQLLQQLSQHAADLATNLGVGTQEARELTHQAGKMSASMGMLPEELAAGIGELNKAFGTTQKFSDDTVKTFGQLTHLYGLTNQEASEFVKLSKLSGEDASDTALTYKTQIQALKERNNVAISEKEVMAEIAKSSAAMQLSARGQGKSLAEAAFHAKKMGLSLKQAEGIGDNLLDFESSIAKEMEAELLIGRDLNLERARSAALQGDLATVAKEVAGQIGSAAEFGKMNVIQQKALADSVGVSRDELAEMLKTQELLAGSGFDDMNEAQKEFKKLLKETGSEEKALAKMKEMGASDALQDQMRQVSLAEKRAQEERNIAEAQANIAGAVNKVFSAFNKVKGIIKDVKVVIVEQMKPFFDSFGGMVGKGGDAFKEKVLPYAKAFGKFMNDVGLRLVSIVNDNGPKIGDIFSGVLKMFGAIYEVVGGVIKRLLGIQDAGSSAGGMFSGIKDTIDSIITKLKNVDISAITEKVKTFIEGIKNIFSFIMEKIGTIGSFLGQNKGLTKAMGVGTLAMTIAPGATKSIVGASLKGLGGLIAPSLFGKRGQSKSAPMFVQDVGGGAGGGLMDMVGQMGGRQAGIGGGFKKGWKGLLDYTKMAFKGGREGQVGRARLMRAGKGLLTGQGASFVGGTGKDSAKAAMKLAGAAGKLGSVGKTLGRLAAGGGIGAIAGLAVEATLGHFQAKASKAADAMDDQIAVMDDGVTKDKAIQDQKDKYAKADALAAAGTVGKYTAIGASIGSMIPVVGTAVGAVAGFVAGTVVATKDYVKMQKWRNSEAYKQEKERQRNLKKIQSSQDKMQILGAKMRLEATKKAIKLEAEQKAQFAEKLAGAGTAFEDLKNLDIDHTSDAFRELATDALNAGNVTEEQFAAALKGTISPLEFMNAAASGAGDKLKSLTESALSAAAALGKEKREQVLKEAGVDEDVVNAQLAVLDTFKSQLETKTGDFLTKYEGSLSDGWNTTASEALKGADVDSKAFQKDLIAQLEATGLDPELIESSMARAGEIFAGPMMEDVDISTAEGMAKLMEVLTQQIENEIKDPVTAATAAGAGATLKATQLASETGVVDLVAGITKEQLATDKDLQKSLTDLGVDLTAVMQEGVTGEEYKTAITDMTTELTKAGVEDRAKFDAVIGMLKANQKADLMSKADAARAAGNTTLAEELTAQATALDDFILRPGMSPLKFNEGDLLIGGTQLSDALGMKNPMESAMSAFGNITSKISDSKKGIEPITEKVSGFVDSLFKKEEEKKEADTQNTEALKIELQELKQIMAGFVEQMNQVVNRPIVVEMDGNKVGQAMGQNSYRMQ